VWEKKDEPQGGEDFGQLFGRPAGGSVICKGRRWPVIQITVQTVRQNIKKAEPMKGKTFAFRLANNCPV